MFANISVLKKSHSGVDNHLDYLIYVCLCFYLLFDSVTGYLLEVGGPSISAIYKPFLLLLMILSVALKNVNIICLVAFLFSFMFLSAFTHIVSDFPWNSESLAMSLQIISNQVYFIYFYFLLKPNNRLEKYTSNKFLAVNIFVFLCNIILGIFGFGFYTYRFAEIGIRGFFYAGNQVSVLFICLYYIVLMRISTKSNKILLVYAIGLVISLLITTRVSVAACILISCIDYYFRSPKKRIFYIKLFSPFLLLILIGLFVQLLPQTQFWQNVEHNFRRELGNRGNLADAVSSGRVTSFRNNYEVWSSYSSPAVILFGFGPVIPQRGRVEIDFFDTFFHIGAVFTFFTLLFYIFLIYMSIRIKNMPLFLFNLLYLSISFTAGHVWHSVMPGLFYAYINAYTLVSYLNEKDNQC